MNKIEEMRKQWEITSIKFATAADIVCRLPGPWPESVRERLQQLAAQEFNAFNRWQATTAGEPYDE